MRTIDHFMLGGARLDHLAGQFGELTGAQVQAGGRHPDLGTHNALLGTGGAAYLELIAPDPSVERCNPLRNELNGMIHATLCRFIVQAGASDFPALAEVYADEGWAAPVYDLSRETPTGQVLRWQLMIPDAGPAALFAPFFIDWQNTPHPSQTLPDSGCRWRDAEAGHPQASWLRELWQHLGVEIPVVRATRPYLRVVLEAPLGDVVLHSG